MDHLRPSVVSIYLLAAVAVTSAFWPFQTLQTHTSIFDIWNQATKSPPRPPVYQPPTPDPSPYAYQPTNLPQQWQVTPPAQPTTTPPPASAPAPAPAQKGGQANGCFHKGVWYSPLSEISKGRSGDWCYGSYCDHNGEVIFWDDFNCATAPTTKKALVATTTTAAPVPNNRGCWYQGRWYPSGSDIHNYSDYYMCYGVYCDWASTVVHWEDSCYNTVPPPPATPTPKPDIYRK